MKYRNEIIVFVVTLMVYALTRWDTSPYNAHVLQAQAFLHGHAWIDCPDYIERALVNGRRYQLHPPLPALILTPLVAVGMTNQNWFALVIGALDAALVWRLLGQVSSTKGDTYISTRIWLTTFFAFGTIMWYETINGSSWEVSMLVANLMTLLALNEVFGNARPLFVGLWAGLAALGRYDLCLAWPVYFVLCAIRRTAVSGATRHSDAYDDADYASDMRPRWQSLWRLYDARAALAGFVLAAGTYIWFNESRYGTLTDVGLRFYNPINGNMAVTNPPTLFAFRYFPGNFFTLFYMAPKLDATFPYFHPMAGGQSILTTSPAFLLALRAKLSTKGGDATFEGKHMRTRLAAGRTLQGACSVDRAVDVSGGLIALMALLSALPVLFYVGNGMSQFGTRHFVAVFPFLLVLMAMAELDQMGKILIVVSVAAIALGIYSIREFGL